MRTFTCRGEVSFLWFVFLFHDFFILLSIHLGCVSGCSPFIQLSNCKFTSDIAYSHIQINKTHIVALPPQVIHTHCQQCPNVEMCKVVGIRLMEITQNHSVKFTEGLTFVQWNLANPNSLGRDLNRIMNFPD